MVNRDTRTQHSYNFTTTRNAADDIDDEANESPRSNEERLLHAIETKPHRIKATATKTKLLHTNVPNLRSKGQSCGTRTPSTKCPQCTSKQDKGRKQTPFLPEPTKR